MPIYEYRCEACGHRLDALQKISDGPLKGCPQCGEPALKRLMSAPAFRLKGSGWYETDFKSDKEKKRNLVEKPADAAKPEKPADSAKADGPAKSSDDGGAKGAKTVPAESKSPSKDSAGSPKKQTDRPSPT